MTARSYSRGHEIVYRDGKWVYADTVATLSNERPCKQCGRKPINDMDACLGRLPSVEAACCGHGRPKDAVMVKSGTYLPRVPRTQPLATEGIVVMTPVEQVSNEIAATVRRFCQTLWDEPLLRSGVGGWNTSQPTSYIALADEKFARIARGEQDPEHVLDGDVKRLLMSLSPDDRANALHQLAADLAALRDEFDAKGDAAESEMDAP